MTRQYNETLRTGIALLSVIISISFVSAGIAADTNVVPATWLGDASKSDDADAITFTSTAPGSITISFAAQSGFPSYAPATVEADAGVADSPFAGDYVAAGAVAVSFRICGDGRVPRRPSVVLVGKQSGRHWYNPGISVSPVAGEWTENVVDFDYANGWLLEYGSGSEGMWLEDLADVGMIGVSMMQYGASAQSYTIDSFRLVGGSSYITPPAGLTPLEQDLFSHFGVTNLNELTEAQKALDTDNDGMLDINEILSENDPAYAASIFVAEALPSSGEIGITVQWACVDKANYTVFRTESLTEPFHAVSPTTQANGTGYMKYTDVTATGAGPYFYRIVKH